ncbi:MAG: hypothetical protein HOQ09_12360 [Gemmatimonadaceae bacterium]|nr:hypothetical protein [Gemmatimonadaceae bacterium]
MRCDLRHLQLGRRLAVACLTAALVASSGRFAGAQVVGTTGSTARAHLASNIAVDSGDSTRQLRDSIDAALRMIRMGALQVGDRVVLRVPGVATLSDTFVVHAGRVLELPDIPAIPLAGVGREDLEHHLRLELARYVRDTAAIEARSLTRVSVVGDVNAPGYYSVAPDALVSDVLMRAGGLSRTAAADRITVRRGSITLWKPEDLHRAMASGETLDELGFRAGDEIVVPSRRDWGEYMRTGALVAGAVVSVLVLRHR